jgi:hypothetical protein
LAFIVKMGIKDPLGWFGNHKDAEPQTEQQQDKKIPDEETAAADRASSDVDAIDEKAQAGVKKMEATTKAWSKSHLIAAYVL